MVKLVVNHQIRYWICKDQQNSSSKLSKYHISL